MKLVLKGPDEKPIEPGRDFSVMVSFDDDLSAKRADELLLMLEQRLRGEEGRLFHQWWNTDVLAFTSMGELAALEAAVADMIILALHDGQELPNTVAVWMKRFLERRDGRPGALVAVLDSDLQRPDFPEGMLSQLKQAAAVGQMDFFATRVRAGGDLGKGGAGGDECATRVASESAAQFVMACKGRAQRKPPGAGKAPAATCGVVTP
jgi:hypothetical protein